MPRPTETMMLGGGEVHGAGGFAERSVGLLPDGGRIEDWREGFHRRGAGFERVGAVRARLQGGEDQSSRLRRKVAVQLALEELAHRVRTFALDAVCDDVADQGLAESASRVWARSRAPDRCAGRERWRIDLADQLLQRAAV